MKIKKLTITSPTTLDLELDITSPVCVLHGEHSELALDLIRELIGDYGAKTDLDCYDDGHFVILSDIEIDDKNYSVCYIRNADYIGDNRIAANFVLNSLDYSQDDTVEYMKKCALRDKDSSNVCHVRCSTPRNEDERPMFLYYPEIFDLRAYLHALIRHDRQVFVAVSNEYDTTKLLVDDNIQILDLENR